MLEPDVRYQTSKFVRSLFGTVAIMWILFDLSYIFYYLHNPVQSFFPLSDIFLHQIFIVSIWLYYRREVEPVILKKQLYAIVTGRACWFIMYVINCAYEQAEGRFLSLPEFAFYFLTMLCMSFWITVFCSLL